MDRKVRIPLYVLMILIISSTAGPIVSVWLSTRIAKNGQAAAIEADREATCIEHGAVITVFRALPELTPAGRGLLATYEDLYARNRCAEDPPDGEPGGTNAPD